MIESQFLPPLVRRASVADAAEAAAAAPAIGENLKRQKMRQNLSD